MSILSINPGLYTDHYELTMAQGYYFTGKDDVSANFDYFYRKNPFGGGYAVFAGLSDLLDFLHVYKFEKEDLDYLASVGFKKDFLKYLEDFRFSGDVYSVREGEVIFSNEQVFRVEGTLLECQIIETLVLNILNFETLIATKAARIKQVAGERTVIDFGLRRSQGLGSIHASKACIIGGAESTSNVYSAYLFGLNSTGTMAHSWIQSFENEYQAFQKFAEINPEKCILLVDTYDTLKQGIRNAIRIAREMEKKGQKLFGIRLDSGDLAYLSKKARKMLDEADLRYVKIAASNQLDEYVIQSLIEQKAPIDTFGVGTSLITGRDDAALDGVYKLSWSHGKPRLKISENKEKIIFPGVKELKRFIDNDGYFYADGITLAGEGAINKIHHPNQPEKSAEISLLKRESLISKVMSKGQVIDGNKSVSDISTYAKDRLQLLPEEHKRFINPHIYKVGVSRKLLDLRSDLINRHLTN
jgi:nicotinate phosphoribosyltransferase